MPGKERLMGKTLLIQNYRLGDILQAIPLLQRLREREPEKRISFLIDDFCKDMLPFLRTWVDEPIVFPRTSLLRSLKIAPGSLWSAFLETDRFCEELEENDFSKLINLKGTLPSAALPSFFPSDEILGPSLSRQGFLTSSQPWTRFFFWAVQNRWWNRFNVVDLFSLMAEIRPALPPLEVAVEAEQENRVSHLIKERGIGSPLIGIQTGASKRYKKWGQESFIRLADMLALEEGAEILFFGSEREREEIDSMMGEVKGSVRNMAGETTLQELAAWLKKCSFLVTGDTLTMHLAAAVGTPVIALFFGPVTPHVTAPYSPGHLIIHSSPSCSFDCNPYACDHLRCCEELKPEDLFTIIKLWKEKCYSDISIGPSSLKIFLSKLSPDSPFKLIPLQKTEADSTDFLRDFFALTLKYTLLTFPSDPMSYPWNQEEIASSIDEEISIRRPSDLSSFRHSLQQTMDSLDRIEGRPPRDLTSIMPDTDSNISPLIEAFAYFLGHNQLPGNDNRIFTLFAHLRRILESVSSRWEMEPFRLLPRKKETYPYKGDCQ